MATVTAISLTDSAVEIGCGALFTCARLSTNEVTCWGDSSSGQLGLGTAFPVGDEPGEMVALQPIDLGSSGTRAQQLAVGSRHACVRLDDDSIKCWGQDAFGALGVEAAGDRGDEPAEMGDNLPTVPLPPDFVPVDVQAGDGSTCVRDDAERILCWGQNGRYATLGIEVPSLIVRLSPNHPFVPIDEFGKFWRFTLGWHHVCFVSQARTMHCWGWNEFGQHGRGTRLTTGRSPGEMVVTSTPAILGRGCALCAVGQSCRLNQQCDSTLCLDAQCAPAGCGDGARNGAETDIDCGGGTCPQCQPSEQCLLDDDCVDGRCIAGQCSTCADEESNGRETDVDCGGPDCGPCPDGSRCSAPIDCASFSCTAGEGELRCAARSCDDLIANGTESDVDCGGADCGPCQDGSSCLNDADCSSGQCIDQRCISCADGERNGAETDIDCGGDICAPCEADSTCAQASDCSSGRCRDGTCTLESCSDGVLNGGEGDIDCGGSTPIQEIAVGTEHTCFLFAGGSVKCVGANERGILGVGDDGPRGGDPLVLGEALPRVGLATNLEVADIQAGWRHTCVLTHEGRVICWGNNDAGQLGLGHRNHIGDDPEEMEQPFSAMDTGQRLAIAIAVGGNHTCVMFSDGQIGCFGDNAFGQLGLGHTDNRGTRPEHMGANVVLVSLPDGTRAVSLAAGGQHVCAVLDDASVRCWGRGDSGQLGLGSREHRGDDPNEMGMALPDVRHGSAFEPLSIKAGRAHTCARFSDDRVKCWGDNLFGQLGIDHARNIGDDAVEMGQALAAVEIIEPISAVELGDGHTCALLAREKVQCWGNNVDGQLGLGIQAPSVGTQQGEMTGISRSVDLGQGTRIRKIALGGQHTCILQSDRTPKCFGQNEFGQLGLGDLASRGRFENELGLALGAPALGIECRACEVGEQCQTPQHCRTLTCSDNGRCAFSDAMKRIAQPAGMRFKTVKRPILTAVVKPATPASTVNAVSSILTATRGPVRAVDASAVKMMYKMVAKAILTAAVQIVCLVA